MPLGDKVFFAALDYGVGIEPWLSDGTSTGTSLVRDLCPGECWVEIRLLGTIGRTGLFLAVPDPFREASGEVLWRSDGTREGTVPVVTAEQGGPAPCFFDHMQSTTVNGVILFTAGSHHRCGLWRTDGTRAGTRPLAPELSGFGSDPILRDAIVTGGFLFFFEALGREAALWRSDGTEAGTVRLRSFPWNDDSFNDHPRFLTALGSRAYFLARGEEDGDEELWTSDGTAAGTRPVTRFAPANPFLRTHFLKVLDGVLYFVADDATSNMDLWRSDGTEGGTRRVTEFGYATPFPFEFRPDQLAKAGDRLVFFASDGLSGERIWTSGSTPTAMKPLEGCPGGCPRVDYSTRFMTVGRRVVFTGFDEVRGMELWSTDGTGAGTRLIGDFCSGSCSSQPSSIVSGFGRLLFPAGGALWSTDGTPQGTVRLANFDGWSFSDLPFGQPFRLVFAGQKAFFSAGHQQRGQQLWVTDGTPEGTGLVSLIGDTGPGSAPRELTPFGNDVVFSACDGQGESLWRSSGTAAATLPLAPLWQGCSSASFFTQGAVKSAGLLFVAGAAGLWRSDGTDAGTFPVTPTVPSPERLVAFGNGVVFAVSGPGSFQVSLWASDGSAGGARKLFETPPDLIGMVSLRNLGRSPLFHRHRCGRHGLHTTLGDGRHGRRDRSRLTSFESNAFDSFRSPEMIRIGTTVFFVAGSQLWKTDGTPAGTARVLPSGGFNGSHSDGSDRIPGGSLLHRLDPGGPGPPGPLAV